MASRPKIAAVCLLAALAAGTAARAEEATAPQENAVLPHDCKFDDSKFFWIELIGKKNPARLLLDAIVDGEGRIRKATIVAQEANGELAHRALSYLESGRCEVPPGWGTRSAAGRHIKYSLAFALDTDAVLPDYPEANLHLVSRANTTAGPMNMASMFVSLRNVLRDKLAPGFKLEPVQAEPAPGKGLKPGDEVSLHVVVSYGAPEDFDGTLQVRLVDGTGSARPFGNMVIERPAPSPGGAMSFDAKTVIPKGIGEMDVVVLLLPAGKSEPNGRLRMVYPVFKP